MSATPERPSAQGGTVGVFFDLETGGVEPEQPNIQLAAVAVDRDWNERETFERKISFDHAKASPVALAINGWTREAWLNAPSEREVVKEFAEFLARHASEKLISARTGRPYWVARLVAHNAGFDGPRLKAMFDRYSTFMPADLRIRDTLQLALWYYDAFPPGDRPANYKLETLLKHLGLPVETTHEALADVRLTIQLARKLAPVLSDNVRQMKIPLA